MIRALVLVCVVVFLLLQSGLMDAARISVRGPSFVGEGQYVRYMVQISPDAENRALVVAALDGSVERSKLEDAVAMTRKQLEGLDAPRTWNIEWREGLPAGEYLVIAAVFSATHESARSTVPLTVLGR